MTVGPDGMTWTSSRLTSISGWAANASVMYWAKTWRSTARACPAGTLAVSAAAITNDPRPRISSFSRPTAATRAALRKELEQTSSASLSVWWASVGRTGRISYRRTVTPWWASCQAASLPANPPPMTVTERGNVSSISCLLEDTFPLFCISLVRVPGHATWDKVSGVGALVARGRFVRVRSRTSQPPFR